MKKDQQHYQVGHELAELVKRAAEEAGHGNASLVVRRALMVNLADLYPAEVQLIVEKRGTKWLLGA